MPPILTENLEVDDEGFSHVNIPGVRICFLWDNLCPSYVLFNVTMMYGIEQFWCRAQRVGFFQCWAGSCHYYKSRVVAGSGRDECRNIWTVISGHSTYARVFPSIMGISGILFLEVLGSEPNEYEVLCLKYPGMSGHTQYFRLPKISSLPKMSGIPKS